MLRSLGYWAAAGFLLAACGSLAAEDRAPLGPVAWVEVLPSDPEAEALRAVVDEVVRYRLAALGLAVRLQGAPARIPPAGRMPASSASLLENAGRAGADFALECRYSGSGSRLSLLLNWYEVSSRLMTSAVDRKGRVDLVLDMVILEALDELLERERGRIAERIAAYGPRPASAPAAQPDSPSIAPLPAVGAAVPAGPAGPAEPRPATGSPAASGAIPEPGAVPGAEAPPAAERYEGARLLIAPSLAPFVAVGAASYYFPIGYQSILQIHFLPAGAKARLGLGSLLGVTAFQAQGANQSSLNFLIPIGLSLRYSLELGRRWGFLFQLGGGVAILVMGTDSMGDLAKPLPYVRSGVGTELALGRRMSLGLEAAYEVYFESPYLIMGFTPGLCLSWRL